MSNANNVEMALDKILEFRRASRIPKSNGNPLLINSGRLVEVDPDSVCTEVRIFNDDKSVGYLFADNIALMNIGDEQSYNYIVKGRTGHNFVRRLLVENTKDVDVVTVISQEKEAGKWKPLMGSDSDGVQLTLNEWDKVQQFARLWYKYGEACEANRKARIREDE